MSIFRGRCGPFGTFGNRESPQRSKCLEAGAVDPENHEKSKALALRDSKAGRNTVFLERERAAAPGEIRTCVSSARKKKSSCRATLLHKRYKDTAANN
jgi:hypothetical protein